MVQIHELYAQKTFSRGPLSHFRSPGLWGTPRAFFTCQYIFILCQKPLLSRINEALRATDWFGDRVVLLGDRINHVPECLLPSDFDLDALSLKRNGKSSEVEAERTYSLKLSVIVDKYFYHREPADVFAYLQPDYEIDKRRIEENLLWRELHSRRKFAKESYNDLSRAWNDMFLSIYKFSFLDFLGEAEEEILKNLTAMEYVRASGIYDEELGNVNLATALKCMACFSNNSEVDPDYINHPESLYRGRWAGHRLGISTMEVLKAEIEADKSGKMWKDVTEEVRAIIRSVGKDVLSKDY